MEVKPVLPLLLDEIGAQEYSGINRYTLRALRRRRAGPVIVKLGALVRFRPADLDAYVAEHVTAPCDLPAIKRRVR